MPERILLVDPQLEHRDALELALDGHPCVLRIARDAESALACLDEEGADLAICAPNVAGLDGFDLVPQMLRRSPSLEVALCVAVDDPARFEAATQLGVGAILNLPIDRAELRFVLQGMRRRIEQNDRNALLERDVRQAVGDKPIIGASPGMIDLLEAMERAAGFKTPVAIEGETGTHREVLARAIHAQSLRRAGPFVSVRCTASSSSRSPVR